MKLFYTTPVALVIALFQTDAVYGQWKLQRQLEADMYGRIVSDDYYEPDHPSSALSACIEVRNGNPRDDQKLILGDCESPGGGWRFDSEGLVHTELDDDQCMQAGRDGPARDGEKIRMFRCDASNDLQKFVFINGGGIRPQVDQDLCVVWHGTHANVGRDLIILKECDKVDDRIDWSGDFI